MKRLLPLFILTGSVFANDSISECLVKIARWERMLAISQNLHDAKQQLRNALAELETLCEWGEEGACEAKKEVLDELTDLNKK